MKYVNMIYIPSARVLTHSYTYMHIYMYTYTYMHIYTHTYMHIYIYIHIPTCIYIHIHTCIYIHACIPSARVLTHSFYRYGTKSTRNI